MNKKYLVIWHYIANHGEMRMEAKSPLDCINSVLNGFSEDFSKKGRIYVIEETPNVVIYDGRSK